MNLSMRLCLLISFSTREYSILLTAFFYIISQPSLFFRKRGPGFPILLPRPPFPRPPPRPPASPTIRYQCLVPPRTNPQTMPTGQAQRLTLRPTPVSALFSIPVCFRSQTRPAYRPSPSLCCPLRFITGATDAPPKRGRGRPKGSKNKKSGTLTADAAGEETPKRKRGRPPKVRIILISSSPPSRVPPSHHSSFPPYSLSHRERLRMRARIPHRNVNAVVLPRTPSRTPMRTAITSSLLNPARQPRRGGRVGPARSRTIDTTDHVSRFKAIAIARERLAPPCTGPLCP